MKIRRTRADFKRVWEFRQAAGTRAESKISTSFRYFKAQWFKKVVKGSQEDDHKAIDFWVHTTLRDEPIPLQVKSNRDDARRASKINPDIPVVAIWGQDTDSVVRQKVFVAISTFLKISDSPTPR